MRNVVGRRAGRPDYSQSLFRTAIPDFKQGQRTFSYTTTETICYEPHQISTPEFEYKTYIKWIYLSADANIMLDVQIFRARGDQTIEAIAYEQGYQNLYITFPHSVIANPGEHLEIVVDTHEYGTEVKVIINVFGLMEVGS